MKTSRIAQILFLAFLTVFAVSCKDTNLYDPNAEVVNEQPTVVKVANTFDFSTVQDVNLTVDYSAFKSYGQVFFSIYYENPIVGEGDDEHLDESIAPIFEDFTKADGKYNNTIKLS